MHFQYLTFSSYFSFQWFCSAYAKIKENLRCTLGIVKKDKLQDGKQEGKKNTMTHRASFLLIEWLSIAYYSTSVSCYLYYTFHYIYRSLYAYLTKLGWFSPLTRTPISQDLRNITSALSCSPSYCEQKKCALVAISAFLCLEIRKTMHM